MLLRGGKHRGSCFEPTVVGNVPVEAEIAWEETFGPVVVTIKSSKHRSGHRLSNKSRYGLDSCVFTNNLYTAWKVAKSLEEG